MYLSLGLPKAASPVSRNSCSAGHHPLDDACREVGSGDEMANGDMPSRARARPVNKGPLSSRLPHAVIPELDGIAARGFE